MTIDPDDVMKAVAGALGPPPAGLLTFDDVFAELREHAGLPVCVTLAVDGLVTDEAIGRLYFADEANTMQVGSIEFTIDSALFDAAHWFDDEDRGVRWLHVRTTSFDLGFNFNVKAEAGDGS